MKPDEENQESAVVQHMQATVQKATALSPMSLQVTDALLKQAEHLIASGLLPDSVQTPQGAVVIMQYGRELGFSPMAAFQNVYVVNGKPSLATKATAGILIRGGVYHRTLQDDEEVLNAEGQLIDRVTTIEMTRGPVVEKFSFRFTDAMNAGLTSKDVWKKYRRNMMWWRCYSMLADRVAPDLTMGMPDTAVMADVHNVDYELSADGEITIK